MRVSMVEMAKGNESVSKGQAKRLPIKSDKLGLGKVNPGQNLFGASRLRDGSHFGQADQGKRILYVCWRPEAERNEPHNFLRNQANGKQTQVNFPFVPDG